MILKTKETLPINLLFISLSFLGVVIGALLAYSITSLLMDSGHIENTAQIIESSQTFKQNITVAVITSLSITFGLFILLGRQFILKPYRELEYSKKDLIKAIQIPHNNPNPILQFNYAGELVFANIAAYSEFRLKQGRFSQNKFIDQAKKLVFQTSKENSVKTSEIKHNNKHYLNYATPVRDGNRNVINIYSIDISQMKRYQEELKEEKESAIEASRVKSEFLANMSHELRTPMNGVISLSELLSKMNLPDEAHKYTETILTSSQTLLAILNDILDVSKVESGELVLEANCVDLNVMLTNLRQLYAPVAKEKDIKLTLTLREDVPTLIKCDMGRLLQITRNLVGNALKFTKYGEVSIIVSYQHEYEKPEICIHIKDSGIGIPESKIMTIFDKFTQADASVTREFGGTGLGLAITKELVHLMGGSIGVESKEGFGSTFYFSIPYVAPEEGEAPINSIDIEHLDYDIRIHNDVSVLAVDDTEMNLFCLKKVLNEIGINVIDTAANGEEAYALMTNVHYDIVFMDCMMPVLDGYQTTEMFRQHEKDMNTTERQTIIAMTANAMVGDKEKSLKSGMDDHISKPIHTEIIKAKLAKWLDNSRYDVIDSDNTSHNTTKVDDEDILLDELLGKDDTSSKSHESIFEAHGNVFDYDQLNMFSNGDKDMELHIIRMFIEQAEESIPQLYPSIEQTDWQNLVHKIKGLAGNLGATQLFNICKDAEFADPHDKEEWVNRIKITYETLNDVLTEAYGPSIFDKPISN